MRFCALCARIGVAVARACCVCVARMCGSSKLTNQQQQLDSSMGCIRHVSPACWPTVRHSDGARYAAVKWFAGNAGGTLLCWCDVFLGRLMLNSDYSCIPVYQAVANVVRAAAAAAALLPQALSAADGACRLF
jgi:hypothetical protein